MNGSSTNALATPLQDFDTFYAVNQVANGKIKYFQSNSISVQF